MKKILSGKIEARLNDSCFSAAIKRLIFLIFICFNGTLPVHGQPDKNSSQPSLAAIGQVRLVLGRAYVTHDDEVKRILKGQAIFVGDRIDTEDNGHVHIKFVDEALVSVRPGSTLGIELYQFSESNPSDSAVKFSLTEGVTRSISGKAAKAAKQRYRLNTPIAAIGVRGTDFVVKADSRSTRALVNEGAIVMAPFSSECVSGGLGPCVENAVELAASSFQAVELRSTASLPTIESTQSPAQVNDFQDRFQLSRQTSSQTTDESSENSSSSAFLESAASGKVTEANDNVSVQQQLDFTPKGILKPDDLSQSQLAWGRFGIGKGGAEKLSVERSVAASERAITIAASDYLLYRAEPFGARVAKNLGIVGFELKSAQAFYTRGGIDLPLQVAGGSLNLDFVNNQFATTLNLNQDLLGPLDFASTGRIADGGYLLGIQKDQSVVGAVSVDGREAGYYFEQSFDLGSLNGLTLWGDQ
jgi:hypothetical protein